MPARASTDVRHLRCSVDVRAVGVPSVRGAAREVGVRWAKRRTGRSEPPALQTWPARHLAETRPDDLADLRDHEIAPLDLVARLDDQICERVYRDLARLVERHARQ